MRRARRQSHCRLQQRSITCSSSLCASLTSVKGNTPCRYQGYIGAYLIIGGVDALGPKLVSVSANGNSMPAPYLADGSGSLAAISIFEKDYKFDMEVGVSGSVRIL